MLSRPRRLQVATALFFGWAILGLWRAPSSMVEHETVWGLVGFQGLAELHAFRSDVALQEDDPRRDKTRALVGEFVGELATTLNAADGIAIRDARGRTSSLTLVAKDSPHATPLCAAPTDDALAAKVGMAAPRVLSMNDGLHISARGEAQWVRGIWLAETASHLEVRSVSDVWRTPTLMKADWLLLSHNDLSGWGASTVCAVKLAGSADTTFVPELPRPLLRERNFASQAAPVLRARVARRLQVALSVFLAGALGAASIVLAGRGTAKPASKDALPVVGHLSRAPLAVALVVAATCSALALMIWNG